MAKKHDWVPRKIGKFRTFAGDFYEAADDNQLAWNLIGDNVTALGELFTTFDDFYDISKNKATRSKIDTKNTDDARKPLEKAIRKMGINEMKNNPNMTNSEREAIGVTNDSDTLTDAQVMSVSPGVEFTRKGILVGEWDFDPKGLPDGQQGIIVKIGYYTGAEDDKEPAEEDCTQTDLFSKAPHVFIFPPKKKGMRFIAYIRYINTRKVKGKAATIYRGIVS